MTRRRGKGSETFNRLRDWDQGSAAAERLAGHVLRVEGYQSVDPAHPLGGPDGLQDINCVKDGMNWRAACYFPRRQQKPASVERKFRRDMGNAKNDEGFVFVTNQEVSLAQRRTLLRLAPPKLGEIIHLERVASILDSPPAYGIRLEFLDLEMTKEEQLAFIASRDASFGRLERRLEQLFTALHGAGGDREKLAELKHSVPLADLHEFKWLLDSITGFSWSGGTLAPHMTQLRVPIQELREFEEILHRVVPSAIYGGSTWASPTVRDLGVPLEAILEYEKAVDRIIEKMQTFPDLNT